MAADWREGLRLRWDCRSPRQICPRAQGLTEAVPEWVRVAGGEGFTFPHLVAHSPPPQVSEAPDGQRRLHSLSVSSDTTADSFSSLNPEEVRSGCWLSPRGEGQGQGTGLTFVWRQVGEGWERLQLTSLSHSITVLLTGPPGSLYLLTSCLVCSTEP